MNKIIEAKGLYKYYKLGQRQQYYTIRDSISNVLKLKREENSLFCALKNVTFDMEEGEVLGVIGPNGSGKSTLLKILARITPPTKGKAILRGRVGSLLEVGTGFHPELTGKENIYLNGAILGMSRIEIKQKFDEIVEFAGVQKFIDTPVKRYSSGMYVRLAFAVAANLNTEILLVDEVLAVGDIEFQKKCLGKMGEISKQGKSIIFVSHNMGSIRALCDRAILITAGSISAIGKTDKVVTEYVSMYSQSNKGSLKQLISQYSKDENARIKNIVVRQNNNASLALESDKITEIEIDFEVLKQTANLRLYVDLIDSDENTLLRSFHDESSGKTSLFKKGRYTAKVYIPKDFLSPRNYNLSFGLTIHNSKSCLLGNIRIPVTVIKGGVVSINYPDSPIVGKLSIPLDWKILLE